MSRALFTTRLKVSDPTAMTALATLRQRFGFGARLAALSREELFFVETTLDPVATREVLEDLIRRTNLFMNPNKHVGRLLIEDEAAPAVAAAWGSAAAPAAATPGSPPGGAAATGFLLVWTPGEGSDLLESVEHHAGVGGFTSLVRGWLWCFTGGPEVDAAGLLAMARQSGELRSRGQGFLVHPAYQEHRLYANRPSLYDIGSLMSPDPATRHPQESRP